MNASKTIRMTVIATAIAAACSWATAQDAALYESYTLPDAVVFESKTAMGMDIEVDMIITGPEDFYLRESFEAGELIEFNPAAMAEGYLPDGTYRYELQIMGIHGVSSDRNSDRPAITESLEGGSGAFSIQGGQIVSSNVEEAPYKGSYSGARKGTSGGESVEYDGAQEQTFNDNVEIIGSLCVGFDCTTNESFGFDTIRMKENNTRIKFDDTSTTGSFPNHDWQLTANDSNNGGLNKFSIEDITAGSVPFTVEGSAPSNSLYIDDSGRVGLGTSTPVVQAHMRNGNTPALRLEQDGSSGFTAQTWDMGGNEANFFIRDITNGSSLPFRIRPGAPESSIDIAASGNVGVGTSSPGAKLHVRGTSGNTSAIIEEAIAITIGRQLFTLQNNGPVSFGLINSDLGTEWRIASQTTGLRLSLGGSGGTEFEVRNDGSILAGPGATTNFTFDGSTGDLSIGGTLSQGSSKAIKTAIESLNGVDLIEGLTRLDFAQWSYKSNPNSRHIGPMAEDFFNIFGLGESDKHIAPGDMAGIAMAASKHLALENAELKSKLKELEQKVDRVDELQSELNRTQAMIETLMDKLNN